MTDRPTRWGIVATGLISNDFVAALHVDDRGCHEIVAVAARDFERAQQFADKHNIPKAYGSYQQLAQDPSIDVVYVGAIPCVREEIFKMMLEAGKPVLSEKPGFINLGPAKRITELAKDKNTLFMEGMWYRFFPAFSKLREVLASGNVGEPKMVHYMMGFKYRDVPNDWRLDRRYAGGIALMFGVYAASLAEWVFNEKPTNIMAVGDLNEKGCDTTSSFVLQYSNNRRCVVSVSSDCKMNNTAFISCTKGTIEIPTPWCPVKLKVNDDWFTYPLPKTDVKFTFVNCPGFIYEADHIRELLQKGATESPVVPHSSTLAVTEVIDDVRKQMGVVYEGD